MTGDEGREIGMLAASRSRGARVIAAMLDDAAMVAARAALIDRPRTDRPRVQEEDVRGALVALARQQPRDLGYPFALWTEG